jgi:cellulose synthase/poly-beta-1,6-N-acetylglucosamine synthase-like glycosyltransferase
VVPLGSDAPFTAARGRKAGLERLLQDVPTCQFVQFIDGDCILQSDWLSTAVRFLNDRADVAVVCGRRFEASPMASIYQQLIDEEWDTPVGPAEACGGDALMRVEALRQVGSFRADLLAGEEPELCNRLRSAGWNVWRIPSRMTEHDARIMRLSQWLRRGVRAGAGYAQVWSATRKTGFPLYGRQIASAILWTMFLPMAVGVCAALSRDWLVLLWLPVAYAVQMMRIVSRHGYRGSVWYCLKTAGVTMVTKFAEASGILRFWLHGVTGQPTTYRAVF